MTRTNNVLIDYVVTVRVDHYEGVRARDPEQAAERAREAIRSRYGSGHTSTVLSVEEG